MQQLTRYPTGSLRWNSDVVVVFYFKKPLLVDMKIHSNISTALNIVTID